MGKTLAHRLFTLTVCGYKYAMVSLNVSPLSYSYLAKYVQKPKCLKTYQGQCVKTTNFIQSDFFKVMTPDFYPNENAIRNRGKRSKASIKIAICCTLLV